MSNNPHGTCASCVWCTTAPYADADNDAYTAWRCWRVSGSPETRLITTSGTEPPACECHLAVKHDGS